MSTEDYWRTLRLKLFLEGHTFDELDQLTPHEWQDINSYMTAQDKAQAKRNKK